MPFAWAVRPVFNEKEELDTTSEFLGVFKQESQKLMDEDLLKLLADYKKYASGFVTILWYRISVVGNFKRSLFFMNSQYIAW